MSQHHEGFGSDSFLDVLANMVGILIILIVVAAIQPVSPDELPATAATEPEPQPADSPPAPETTAPLEPELVEVPPLEPENDAPPLARVRELAKLETEMKALRHEQQVAQAELARLKGLSESTRRDVEAAERAAADKQTALADQQERLARLEQSLGDRKQVLAGLLADFEEAKNARPPVVQIRHRLAPISQEVEGDEVHFRLVGNRVSVIPLKHLVERVKAQLERQKDWLARHARNQGSVGPVDGFTLQYVVERQQLSAIEERRLGYGAFRVGVASWELIPSPDAPSESVDEALRRGSRFAAALQAAPEHAALTFWVYPDSFRLFRQLQEAAHAEGFVVAGRPLPEGVPIAGSPNGTRSAGQ